MFPGVVECRLWEWEQGRAHGVFPALDSGSVREGTWGALPPAVVVVVEEGGLEVLFPEQSCLDDVVDRWKTWFPLLLVLSGKRRCEERESNNQLLVPAPLSYGG